MASIEARTAKLYFIANGRFSHSGSHMPFLRGTTPIWGTRDLPYRFKE